MGEGRAPDLALNAAMDRYARGDDAAFGEVYDLLAPRLLGFARRRAATDVAAEDIVQQAMLQMHSAREHYRTGADVVPWAFAITRRILIDARRRSGRECAMGDALTADDRPATEPAADELLIARQTVDVARTVIARLPARQREAFELVRQDGLSLAQAAETLGTTVTAVKLRVHRAYETLRHVLRSPEV